MVDSRSQNSGAIAPSPVPAVDVAKAGAALFGAIYALGSVVVSLHLSRYHVSPFGLLRVQYLLAGLWVLVPLAAVVLPFLWMLAVFDDEWHKRQPSKKDGVQTTLRGLATLAFALFIAASWVSLIRGLVYFAAPELTTQWGTPDVEFLKRYSQIAFLFATGIALFGRMTLLFAARVYRRETERRANAVLWSIIFASFLMAVMFAYIAHFSINVYPRLPSVLGGGAPQRVLVLFRAGAVTELDTEVVKGPNVRVYELLLETDKAYVLVTHRRNNAVLVVAKDMVSAISYLENSHPKP